MKPWQSLITAAFITFESLWFILRILGLIPVPVAYAAVVVCFLYVTVCFAIPRGRNLDTVLLSAALGFTCVADIFLVLLSETGDFVAVGDAVFIVAQTIYFVKIHRSAAKAAGVKLKNHKPFWAALIARAAVFIPSALAALGLFWGQEVLSPRNTWIVFLGLFYIIHLVVNLIFSAAWFKQNPLIPVGLALLTGCDLIIGMVFLGILPGGGALQWVFYMPSQAVLALSVLTAAKESGKLQALAEPPGAV